MTVLRLALDQNFPQPLLHSLRPWLRPTDVDVQHLTEIDERLSDLTDRQLFIALHQLGYAGLVTNNYRMLNIDTEVAAIVETKAIVVAMKGMGESPIRPAGALLLELPRLAQRVKPGRSNVFLLQYEHRPARDGWDRLQVIATRQDLSVSTLWSEVRPTDAEMTTPVLA